MMDNFCKMVDTFEGDIVVEFKKQKLMLTNEQRDAIKDLKKVLRQMSKIDKIITKAEQYKFDNLDEEG